MNLITANKSLSVTSIIALTPYATPKKSDDNITKYSPNEIINQTLFAFDGVNEQNRKFLFNNLDKNLASCYETQTKYIFSPPSQNLHQDSLPRFLHYLCDPSISISSLLPVPVLAGIDFPTLFHSYLFSLHVPPDRAAYVIHYYLFQVEMSNDELTEFIKSLTNIKEKDFDYFIKFVYSLYSKNLLNHMSIIEWLISKFQPELLEIFQYEIFNSYKFLYHTLNSDNYAEYIKIMEYQLIENPSQIVQLAVSMAYSSEEYNKHFLSDVFPLMNDSSKKRANNIIKAIKCNNISLFIKTYIAMSLNFPFYDIPNILSEFQLLFQFLTKEEKKQYILELCSLIHDFPNEHESVTAIAIEIIKTLNVQFPLNEFVDFIYSNFEIVYKYTFFFYELQCQNMINYIDFLRIITITGRSVSEYRKTFYILKNLPPSNYTKIIRGKVRQIFLKDSEALFEYERVFNECCVDIEKNYENAIHLPPYFLYMIGYLIVAKKEYDFFTKSHILAQLNLVPMILSEIKTEEKPVISSFALLQIKHFIPLLYSRGVLDKVVEICTNEHDVIKYKDFCVFLKESYDDSSYMKNYKEKLQSIPNKKVEFIDTEKIAELAYNHSYLFNVFILNDFYNVKTRSDFEKIFFYFLKNLLSFESLCSDILWNFFVSFTESSCISTPLKFFIDNFILVALFGIKINEKVKSIITQFFYSLFSKRFFTGCEYLNTIYRILVSKRVDIRDCENAEQLFTILSSIVSKKPDLFTLSNLLHNSIANWLTICNQHLREIIKPLSSNPIIITQSIINLINALPSNYSAIFFYLLPSELLNDDINEVIKFYFQNIDHRTMLLWTIWLKNRPLYEIKTISGKKVIDDKITEIEELIVTPNYLYNEYPEQYRVQICANFLGIAAQSNDSEPYKMDVYLESFRIFCENQKMANIAFNSIIHNLNQYLVKFPMNSIRLTFYLFSYLNDEQVVNLCTALLRFNLDFVFEEDSTIYKIGYFFLICFSSFSGRAKLKILMSTANKLLQIIPNIYENQYQSTLFLVDCLNYYVSVTSSNDNSFHKEFIDLIKNNLKKLKKRLRKAIILNQPPQMFEESQEPLYVNDLMPSSSLSSELLPGSNQINDLFADDIGEEWF